MTTLHDKYSRVDYNSTEEIITDMMKGQKHFVIEIPNRNIKGLDLEFYIKDDGHIISESKKKIQRTLLFRLVDGEPYYIHYDGWRKIEELDITGIANKIIEIDNNLKEDKYDLVLGRTSAEGVGGITGGCSPYYCIKSFLIDGKEIITKRG